MMHDNTLSYRSNSHFPPHRDPINAEWKHSSIPGTFHVFMDCIHSHSDSSASTNNKSINNSFVVMLIGAAFCGVLLFIIFIISFIFKYHRRKSSEQRFSKIAQHDVVTNGAPTLLTMESKIKEHISTNIEMETDMMLNDKEKNNDNINIKKGEDEN